MPDKFTFTVSFIASSLPCAEFSRSHPQAQHVIDGFLLKPINPPAMETVGSR
jgi:hypothetical protein